MFVKCTHKVCGVCGGVKRLKKVGTLASEKCNPKCLVAKQNMCECKCKGKYHGGRTPLPTTSKQRTLFGLGNMFDYSIIKDLDSLKREYHKLCKIYHPDKGGSTSQFQKLQAEYEKKFKELLSGSKLTNDEKTNETNIDKAIRDIIDNIITLDGITIEVIGKWLWIGGNTYPVRAALKQAGLIFIKKDKVPYWVYKGVPSSSRGNTSMEEIKAKYGVSKFDLKAPKQIKGISSVNRVRLKNALKKLIKGLNQRSV